MATPQPIVSNKTACVIGGTGFVASQLIKLLLEKGYVVKTTARDPGQTYILYRLLPNFFKPIINLAYPDFFLALEMEK